jgi:TolB-like protein
MSGALLQRRLPWRSVLAALIAVLALVALFRVPPSMEMDARTTEVDIGAVDISVQPFISPEAVELQVLAHMFTSALMRHLRRLGHVRVIGPAGADVGGGASPTTDTSASGSTVRLHVTGAVHFAKGRFAIEVTVIDRDSGKVLNAALLEYADVDISDTLRMAAKEIASLVHDNLRWRRSGAVEELWLLLRRTGEIREESRRLRRIGAVAAADRGLLKADSLLSLAESHAPDWVELPLQRARVAADRAWGTLIQPVQNHELARREFKIALQHADRAASVDPDDPLVLETRGSIAYRKWALLRPSDNRGDLLRKAEKDLTRVVQADPNRPRAWSILSGLAYRRADFSGAYWAAMQALQAGGDLENVDEILMRLFDCRSTVVGASGHLISRG